MYNECCNRDIKEPKNVKLLFDVLRFEPAAIHRAVLFVTNNALVCETPEDASRVAYDLDRSKNSRYDVRIRTVWRLCGWRACGPPPHEIPMS